MKIRRLIVSLFFVFCAIGCSNNSKIDLETKGNLLLEKYYLNHEIVDKDTVSKKYDINTSDVSNILFIAPKSYDDATMILVISPNNKNVMNETDRFKQSYEDQWVKFNYFPEQKDLVEKAIYTTYGDYIIYIVSEKNNEILEFLKK